MVYIHKKIQLDEYNTAGFEQVRSINIEYIFDTIIELLLICLLVFMPLAFGTVHAWSRQVVTVISGIILICFMLKLLFQKQSHLTWTWAYISVAVFLILIVFQVIPIPVRLVEIISPNTVGLRNELLGDLQNTGNSAQLETISLYPFATKTDLRILLALAGVFFVVINVFNNPEKIKKLLAVITIIGGAIALIALVQNVFGNGKIYWLIESSNTDGKSGPFVNHCNFSQFMNLSIGSAIALLMIKLQETFAGKSIKLPQIVDYFLSVKSIKIWLIIAVISIGITTIFTSMTRSGVVSMLISIGIVTLLISSNQHLRSNAWIMIIAAMLAFICVLYTGFDAVFDRMASLRNFQQATEYRMQILRDIARLWFMYPLFGTGFGTHSFIYPMFDRTNTTALAAYAENEYAQTIEETGITGLLILVVFGIIITSNCIKIIRANKSPVTSAVYGLVFGLLAVLIQSISDFGQHLPANAFLSVIFCALIISLRNINNDNLKSENTRQLYIPKFLCLAGLCFIIAVVSWSLSNANKSRIAEAKWNIAHDIENNLSETNWQGSEQTYSDLLSYASSALKYEPQNIKYHYWFNVYRWRYINRNENPVDIELSQHYNSMSEILDIVNQLHKTCEICPTFGPAYTLVGQIEKFVLNDQSGSEQIQKGYLLASGDPVACYMAGYMDLIDGKYDECTEKLSKAVQLDESLFEEVAGIYLDYLNRPYAAMSLAGENVSHLSYLANLFEQQQYTDIALQCRKRIQGILEKQCKESDVSPKTFTALADIYRQQQQYTEAIECYQNALALDYSQLGLRIQLIKMLEDLNLTSEALQEAKICLRIHPDSSEAKKLVADLSLNPTGWKEPADTE